MSVSWEAQCHVLYEDIKKQTLLIKEQQEEINRLTIAYQNASDQRQHYVDKCLRLSEVVLEFTECNNSLDNYDVIVRFDSVILKHKDLLNELEHNLKDKN